MHARTALATALALLTLLATLCASPRASAAPTSSPRPSQPEGLLALDGEWIYVEDRTEGRALEDQQPSMSTRLRLRIEEDAFILIRSDGEIRIPLDGSPTDVARENFASRYRGEWKDGAFHYESRPIRAIGDTRTGGLIEWELRVTPEGLIAGVTTDSGWGSVALYRHPDDIPMPTPAPAPATIDDMAWLEGAWVGTRGEGGAISMEERWTPPLGGAMLGVSRTVSRGSMRGFEFLRIVERDGGLVYFAQPGGRSPTEFVLTELTATRAVFENPRHDSPQRIVYEVSPDGGLTASIGFAKGGRPRPFQFQREAN